MKRVNKKSDIPRFVRTYLEKVKNPATSKEMYEYGREHGIFGVYYPCSVKALASQIVGRCKNRICRGIPVGNGRVTWELIE